MREQIAESDCDPASLRAAPREEPSHSQNADIRALIFDVDGTLYRRDLLQRKLLFQFAKAHITKPLEALRIFRALHSYRRGLEKLRTARQPLEDIYRDQTDFACADTGFKREFIVECVEIWMRQYPSSVLNQCLDQQLVPLLAAARDRGLRLGVFSDYPAEEKLEAMGLNSYFDVIVCSGDPEVKRLKPDPRGLVVAMEKLGASKNQAVYIGDRPEIDAAAAGRLGVRCFILGAKRSDCLRWNCTSFSSFHELSSALTLIDADRPTPERYE
jgi:HAD superfamily hydrolase (TIGR01549 family)